MKNKIIGILFGMEESFPVTFVNRINEKKIKGITAEYVSIEKVSQGAISRYAVIVDRISQDVPFYRAFLKSAAMSGTAVINNPFWWSADDKFFNNEIALRMNIPVPNTVILPSFQRPEGTTKTSFKNLKYPLDWEWIFEYIKFPAYMKPFAGGGWKNVYRIKNREDFFDKYSKTNRLVMLLQEEIHFDLYFRCYCIGGTRVHIMPYEPRNPHHLRYIRETKKNFPKELLKKLTNCVIKLNKGLGYDFNTVELAVSLKDGLPYAIDFGNPAPDAEITSIGEDNFEWVVENSTDYAIERALSHKEGQSNLTWGSFVKDSVKFSV